MTSRGIFEGRCAICGAHITPGRAYCHAHEWVGAGVKPSTKPKRKLESVPQPGRKTG